MGIYERLLKHPVRYICWFLFALFVVWAVPSVAAPQIPGILLAVGVTPWDKSVEWAGIVLQLGGFTMVVLGGLIPILNWWTESMKRIVDNKPIVVTDCLDDGKFEVRNLGAAPAVNVWLVVASTDEPIALGALHSHQSRTVPATIVEIERPHILLAEARPNKQRPYTPTFNLPTVAGPMRHGFRPQQGIDVASLERGGSIEEYLYHERAALLHELSAWLGAAAGAAAMTEPGSRERRVMTDPEIPTD